MPLALSDKSWLGAAIEEDDHTSFLRQLLTGSLGGSPRLEIRVGYTDTSLLAQHQMARLSKSGRRSIPSPLACPRSDAMQTLPLSEWPHDDHENGPVGQFAIKSAFDMICLPFKRRQVRFGHPPHAGYDFLELKESVLPVV
jgi:hypothetical protein